MRTTDCLIRELDERGFLVIDALGLAPEIGLTPDNWHDPQAFASALCREMGVFACTVERGPQDFQMTVRRVKPG